MAGFSLTANINAALNVGSVRAAAGQLKQQFKNTKVTIDIAVRKDSISKVKQLANNVQLLNSALSKTPALAQSAAAALGNLTGSANGVAQANRNIANSGKQSVQQIKNITTATQSATKVTQTFGYVTGLALRRNSGFILATSVIYGFGRAVISATGDAISFERELNKVVQVSRASTASLGDLEATITRLAISTGTSANELAKVSLVFAQAGNRGKELEYLLQAVAKSNLAPTFVSMTKTAEGMISAMEQFKIPASEMEAVLGSINAVAGQFAVESDDIIEGIRKLGGTFAAASQGIGTPREQLNQLIAVFTSVRATTREGAKEIATGLRTIFARIQRGSTIDYLDSLGVHLRDAKGEFVGAYEAVNILGDALKGLSSRDFKRIQIVEELGGFRQLSKTIPFIEQGGLRKQALDVATQGAGSLDTDATKALETLVVKASQVREEFKALLREIVGTSTFKAIADSVLQLASAFTSLLGVIKPLLPLLATIGTVKLGQAIFNNIPGFTRGLFGSGGGGAGTPGLTNQKGSSSLFRKSYSQRLEDKYPTYTKEIGYATKELRATHLTQRQYVGVMQQYTALVKNGTSPYKALIYSTKTVDNAQIRYATSLQLAAKSIKGFLGKYGGVIGNAAFIGGSLIQSQISTKTVAGAGTSGALGGALAGGFVGGQAGPYGALVGAIVGAIAAGFSSVSSAQVEQFNKQQGDKAGALLKSIDKLLQSDRFSSAVKTSDTTALKAIFNQTQQANKEALEEFSRGDSATGIRRKTGQTIFDFQQPNLAKSKNLVGQIIESQKKKGDITLSEEQLITLGTSNDILEAQSAVSGRGAISKDVLDRLGINIKDIKGSSAGVLDPNNKAVDDGTNNFIRDTFIDSAKLLAILNEKALKLGQAEVESIKAIEDMNDAAIDAAKNMSLFVNSLKNVDAQLKLISDINTAGNNNLNASLNGSVVNQGLNPFDNFRGNSAELIRGASGVFGDNRFSRSINEAKLLQNILPNVAKTVSEKDLLGDGDIPNLVRDSLLQQGVSRDSVFLEQIQNELEQKFAASKDKNLTNKQILDTIDFDSVIGSVSEELINSSKKFYDNILQFGNQLEQGLDTFNQREIGRLGLAGKFAGDSFNAQTQLEKFRGNDVDLSKGIRQSLLARGLSDNSVGLIRGVEAATAQKDDLRQRIANESNPLEQIRLAEELSGVELELRNNTQGLEQLANDTSHLAQVQQEIAKRAKAQDLANADVETLLGSPEGVRELGERARQFNRAQLGETLTGPELLKAIKFGRSQIDQAEGFGDITTQRAKQLREQNEGLLGRSGIAREAFGDKRVNDIIRGNLGGGNEGAIRKGALEEIERDLARRKLLEQQKQVNQDFLDGIRNQFDTSIQHMNDVQKQISTDFAIINGGLAGITDKLNTTVAQLANINIPERIEIESKPIVLQVAGINPGELETSLGKLMEKKIDDAIRKVINPDGSTNPPKQFGAV